jgi:general secretion pathway protein A
MYQAYFGLKELPFRISPDPRFIYLTSQHQEVLAKCQYSVAEKMGIAAIFGTIGSGKTSLARRLWEQYATQPEYTFALLIHPNYPTPFQFLKAILREYGLIKPKRSLEDMVAYFEEFLIEQHRNGKTPILVIDEAQTLRPPALELLRQLLNFETNTEKLLQIILFGDNDLLLRLDRSPALKDRVTIFGALTSLSRQDSDDLISFRYRVAGGDSLPFDQDALAAIFKYSQGLPRRICRICDNALIRAFSNNQQTVDEAMITSIAEEIRLNEPSTPTKQKAGRKPRQKREAIQVAQAERSV